MHHWSSRALENSREVKLSRGQAPFPVPPYKSLGTMTRKRALGKSCIMEVRVRISSREGGRERESLRFYIHKDYFAIHVLLYTYIVNNPSLHIKTGSPASPKEGDLKGWIKEGKKIIPYNPVYFLHLIIKMHFVHEIPTIKHTVEAVSESSLPGE